MCSARGVGSMNSNAAAGETVTASVASMCSTRSAGTPDEAGAGSMYGTLEGMHKRVALLADALILEPKSHGQRLARLWQHLAATHQKVNTKIV